MNTDVVNLQNATQIGAGPRVASKEMGKNEFLKLLMTQLSAQDPLNPTDATEFTAQLSQFASLEQLGDMNKNLESLVTITGANNAANAVSLLGKEVRLATNKIKEPGTVYYELESPASQVKIEVRNKEGRVVHVREGLPVEKGLQEVQLEGFEKGDYVFSVVAKDSQGREVRSRVSTLEKVRAVNFQGSIPVLLCESGAEFPASDVVEIRQAAKTQEESDPSQVTGGPAS